uniref:Protein kinase domain-containing protein n=1 Tax=Amphora coffeiformis TaxID=265554 RepID=A0A7S3P9Q1_9STRA
MDYIHRKQIVFRDLKHDNIGFDSDNILKIFDFGLAKELRESEKAENGLYHMTGLTGALRYMAPENGLRKPYNQKVDVYSWSMLMWYIMALEPPLAVYTPKMFVERVFERGYRPAIREKWPEELKTLIRQSWDDSPFERPSFDDIKRALRAFSQTIDPELASMMVVEKSNHSSVGNLSFNKP